MDNQCGCVQQSSDDKDFLLVKATASEASTCGVSSQDSTSGCAKQEQMYDVSLNDFVMPLAQSSTTMLVCNGKIYAVNMWLQFLAPVCKLKITNIVNNTLTLVNRCDNGKTIAENPDAAVAINKGAKFIVCDDPPCTSNDELLEQFQNALSEATELCVPSLKTTSATATVYPVGRTESDPSDLGAKKCIRKIFGFFFKAGRPYFSALGGAINADASGNYRPLVKHKVNNGIYQRLNYSETPGLNSNFQYALAVTKTNERILGPLYMTFIKHVLLRENTASLIFTDWPEFTDEDTKEFTITDYPELAVHSEASLDHYYVMARIDWCVYNPSNTPLILEISMNELKVGRVFARKDDDIVSQFVSISVPIKVMKSDHKLTVLFKTATPATVKHYYKLTIDGIHF